MSNPSQEQEYTQEQHSEQEHAHPHEHSHTHDHSHPHDHSHAHGHTHVHSPEEKKKQINSLKRIIGQLNCVIRFIEDDKDCAEVLIQLASSRSQIEKLSTSIIKEHINHCIIHAAQDGDTETIESFTSIIDRLF